MCWPLDLLGRPKDRHSGKTLAFTAIFRRSRWHTVTSDYGLGHTDISEILSGDQQYFRIVAPELLFTSHLGHLVSNQQVLEIYRFGTLKLRELTPSDQQIHCHSEYAVVSVQMHLVGSFNGMPVDEHIRYTRVWAIAATNALHIVAGHASVVSR